MLNSLAEVRESAVVGPDHVHAVIILKTSAADVDALIRRANQRLESHQRIREWSIWPQGEFPRTASTLKIRRHEISRLLHAGTPNLPQAAPLDLSAMSSLERVELLSELENKYQVELDEDSFAKLTSTQELEEWLRRPDAIGQDERERPLSDWARAAPVRWFRTLFQHAVALPLYRYHLPLTVIGLENLEGLESPVIFAANHASHLDVPTIYTALPYRWRQRLAPSMMKDHFRAYFEPRGRTLKEVASAALAYFLSCAIYNAYPLPQQMTGARRALHYTGDLVSRGFNPIVFPEGLRTPDGRIHPSVPSKKC